jgi:hypothetical protein
MHITPAFLKHLPKCSACKAVKEQIKELFAAIRATKHAESIRALREAARDSGNRIRAWKCGAERKRLQQEGFAIIAPSASAVPQVQE